MTTMTVADRLSAAIADAHQAMNDVDREVGEMTNPHELAHLLADLADLKKAASEVYRTVEAIYVGSAGEKTMEIPGVGVVEIKKVTKRTQWDNDALWRTVVARARDEVERDDEGYPLESEVETVSRILRDCAYPSWKVTGLRAHGIQEDEYCVVTPDGWSVKLPSRGGKF